MIVELSAVCDMVQPERRRIIQLLWEEPKNISELARELKLDRATVSYHLGVLEKHNFAKGIYKTLDNPKLQGRIGRFYFLNNRGLKKALTSLSALTKELEKYVSKEK